LGITLLTVTHRRSLQQLHQHVMKFDGNGSYKMGRVRDPAFAVGLACHAQGAAVCCSRRCCC
jgi:hypothetical protein